MRASLFILFLTFTFSLMAQKQPRVVPSFMSDSKGGGGGDVNEARVDEIRSDILKWIDEGGASGLDLPSEFTLEEYVKRMKYILQPKVVVVTFVENDKQQDDELKVIVDGKPKTCRGFISQKDSIPNILCHKYRFNENSDSDQYRLIHHEYAGLVSLEKNIGAASDYFISNQITDFLTIKSVLKLSVKRFEMQAAFRLISKQDIILEAGHKTINFPHGESGCTMELKPSSNRRMIKKGTNIIFDHPTVIVKKIKEIDHNFKSLISTFSAIGSTSIESLVCKRVFTFGAYTSEALESLVKEQFELILPAPVVIN